MILAREVTNGPGGIPVLTAGLWATGRPAALNPGYWSLPAVQGIASLTGDQTWRQILTGAVSITRTLIPQRAHAAARLGRADGLRHAAARASPQRGSAADPVRPGPDAQRTVAWFTASCDPAARNLAANWWPLLRPADRTDALALHPNGTVLSRTPAVLPLVASAAAAKAAGGGGTTSQLLRRAASPAAECPDVLRRRVGRPRADTAHQQHAQQLLVP